MARDLDLPVEIVGCPTVREPDGLALSSRNSYLTPQERLAAPVLYRALTAARELYGRGERRGDALRQAMRATLATESLARADYVSVADPDSFRELEIADGPVLLALAVFVGRTRLIDNLRVDVRREGRP
jgi:pantoate--beta-alanine ligase